jgi:hypothetical protein
MMDGVPGRKRSAKISFIPVRDSMIAYPAMLDVPRELVWFCSALLAARRRELGFRGGDQQVPLPPRRSRARRASACR